MSAPLVEPFRDGAGEPLLLLHGGTATWRIWGRVLPLLTPHHEVLAPNLPGHTGGPALTDPATIDSFTDGAEAAMDAVGWDTAHIAGNSLGGWVAMELARRGRARSVVAFSPAGGWSPGDPRVRRIFTETDRRLRRSRLVLPLALGSPRVRRSAFAKVFADGARLSRAEALGVCRDALGSDLANGIGVVGTCVKNHPDLEVPFLLAWSEHDRLLPSPAYSDRWRVAVPHAQWRDLPGVGHVPMYDDPQLVADTILGWTAEAQGSASQTG